MANATLAYSTARINLDYRIKVAGIDNNGNKINTLVGVSGLLNLIGVELANKLLGRASPRMEDNCYCKLRRGLRVTFYSK